MVDTKNFVVGAVVGSGLIARAAEKGGAKFLLAINAGRLRNMGAPSIASMLPMHNATALTQEFATTEVLSQVSIPVYLGVNCWTPESISDEWIDSIVKRGFAGGVNFPTAIHYSSGMQAILHQAQMGVEAEINLLAKIEKKGGQAMFYCRTQQQAVMAADKGLSNIIFNFGWNVGGTRSHQSVISLEEAASIIHDVSRLVKQHNQDTKLFLEGGPILSAEELSFVAREASVDGYVGGSSIDKFPIEDSIANQIARYQQAPSVGEKVSKKKNTLTSKTEQHGLVGNSYVNQHFLEALHRLAHTNIFIELIAEQGQDIDAIIAYIADIMYCPSTGNVVSIEPKSDIPTTQLMAQLFGRRTGGKRIEGLLENKTTALLVIRDHGDMPEALRERIGQMLINGYFQPLGSKLKINPTPRLILVGFEPHLDWTNCNSIDCLPMASIRVPTLRERFEDIDELFNHYLNKLGGTKAKDIKIQPAAKLALRTHTWVDNEAELRQFIKNLLADTKIESVDASLVRNLLSTPIPNTHTIQQPS